MTFIDLCAGIGGFSLGLEGAGMACKGQVEIDEYCNKVLQKHWPDVPRWGDIKTLDPQALPAVELVCGGYPCQPFSQTGHRQGESDPRHIWPYILPIIDHIRPTWCLFENVAGHVRLGLDNVCLDLEEAGYSVGPGIIPACTVGAWQRRDRVWILAHSNAKGDTVRGEWAFSQVAKTLRGGIDNRGRTTEFCGWQWWERQPGVARVVHGVSDRVDRNNALGNAVVPQIVYEIGRCIMAAHYAASRA